LRKAPLRGFPSSIFSAPASRVARKVAKGRFEASTAHLHPRSQSDSAWLRGSDASGVTRMLARCSPRCSPGGRPTSLNTTTRGANRGIALDAPRLALRVVGATGDLNLTDEKLSALRASPDFLSREIFGDGPSAPTEAAGGQGSRKSSRSDGRSVGANLSPVVETEQGTHDLDLEVHTDYRVCVSLLGFLDHFVNRRKPPLVQEVRHTYQLAANERFKDRAELRKRPARENDVAKNIADVVRDLVARYLVGRRDRDTFTDVLGQPRAEPTSLIKTPRTRSLRRVKPRRPTCTQRSRAPYRLNTAFPALIRCPRP